MLAVGGFHGAYNGRYFTTSLDPPAATFTIHRWAPFCYVLTRLAVNHVTRRHHRPQNVLNNDLVELPYVLQSRPTAILSRLQWRTDFWKEWKDVREHTARPGRGTGDELVTVVIWHTHCKVVHFWPPTGEFDLTAVDANNSLLVSGKEPTRRNSLTWSTVTTVYRINDVQCLSFMGNCTDTGPHLYFAFPSFLRAHEIRWKIRDGSASSLRRTPRGWSGSRGVASCVLIRHFRAHLPPSNATQVRGTRRNHVTPHWSYFLHWGPMIRTSR